MYNSGFVGTAQGTALTGGGGCPGAGGGGAGRLTGLATLVVKIGL